MPLPEQLPATPMVPVRSTVFAVSTLHNFPVAWCTSCKAIAMHFIGSCRTRLSSSNFRNTHVPIMPYLTFAIRQADAQRHSSIFRSASERMQVQLAHGDPNPLGFLAMCLPFSPTRHSTQNRCVHTHTHTDTRTRTSHRMASHRMASHPITSHHSIYICLCVYAYMYIFILMFIFVFIFIIFMFIFILIVMYMFISIHTYLCVYIYIYMRFRTSKPCGGAARAAAAESAAAATRGRGSFRSAARHCLGFRVSGFRV